MRRLRYTIKRSDFPEEFAKLTRTVTLKLSPIEESVTCSSCDAGAFSAPKNGDVMKQLLNVMIPTPKSSNFYGTQIRMVEAFFEPLPASFSKKSVTMRVQKGTSSTFFQEDGSNVEYLHKQPGYYSRTYSLPSCQGDTSLISRDLVSYSPYGMWSVDVTTFQNSDEINVADFSKVERLVMDFKVEYSQAATGGTNVVEEKIAARRRPDCIDGTTDQDKCKTSGICTVIGESGTNAVKCITGSNGNICQNKGAAAGYMGGTDGADASLCRCVCVGTGFEGSNCATTALSCTGGKNGHICQHGGSAIGTSGSCSCSCVTGFSGENCESCIGGENGLVCQNGGTAIPVTRIGTSGTCSCSCATGFSGENCETCTGGANGLVCQNGGRAIGTSGTCSCSCVTGFSGGYCETSPAKTVTDTGNDAKKKQASDDSKDDGADETAADVGTSPTDTENIANDGTSNIRVDTGVVAVVICGLFAVVLIPVVLLVWYKKTEDKNRDKIIEKEIIRRSSFGGLNHFERHDSRNSINPLSNGIEMQQAEIYQTTRRKSHSNSSLGNSAEQEVVAEWLNNNVGTRISDLYAQKMIDDGYDDLNALKDLTNEELDELKIKPGHKKKIAKALQSLSIK